MSDTRNGLAVSVMNNAACVAILHSQWKGSRAPTILASAVFNTVKNYATAERQNHGVIHTARVILEAAAQVFDQLEAYMQSEERCAREDAVLKGREVEFRQHHLAIVSAYDAAMSETDFRVVNLVTGSESALYPLDQCKEIIRLALNGELKGSFDL
jgi:hypothetical protein